MVDASTVLVSLKMVVVSRYETDRVDLPPIDLERLGDGEGLKDITDRAVRAVEKAAIAAALRRDRNPAAAAKRLGISRASIYTKMKTYGLAADGEVTES